METTEISVLGMMCDACVGHVTKALKTLPGVETVAVSLADKKALIAYNPAAVNRIAMEKAIEEEGYEVG